MLVRLPSFSGAAAAGKKKTSVLMSAGGGPFGSLFQKIAALGLEPVEDDQPVEVPQARPVQPGIGPAAAGVLAEQEIAFDLALCHAIEVSQLRVVGVDARQPRRSQSRSPAWPPRRTMP